MSDYCYRGNNQWHLYWSAIPRNKKHMGHNLCFVNIITRAMREERFFLWLHSSLNFPRKLPCDAWYLRKNKYFPARLNEAEPLDFLGRTAQSLKSPQILSYPQSNSCSSLSKLASMLAVSSPNTVSCSEQPSHQAAGAKVVVFFQLDEFGVILKATKYQSFTFASPMLTQFLHKLPGLHTKSRLMWVQVGLSRQHIPGWH